MPQQPPPLGKRCRLRYLPCATEFSPLPLALLLLLSALVRLQSPQPMPNPWLWFARRSPSPPPWWLECSPCCSCDGWCRHLAEWHCPHGAGPSAGCLPAACCLPTAGVCPAHACNGTRWLVIDRPPQVGFKANQQNPGSGQGFVVVGLSFCLETFLVCFSKASICSALSCCWPEFIISV